MSGQNNMISKKLHMINDENDLCLCPLPLKGTVNIPRGHDPLNQ